MVYMLLRANAKNREICGMTECVALRSKAINIHSYDVADRTFQLFVRVTVSN